jgi:hypothetical protein
MNNDELKFRILVFLSITLFIGSILSITGTLQSGFHFVDNHEVVQTMKDMSDHNGSIIQVIQKWVSSDLLVRFRPMYMIDNVIVDNICHFNFTTLSIYHCVLIIIIAFLLFVFMRKLNFGKIESISFPIIALVGPQAAIWYRLGPNESIGMWYLAWSLIFMVYSIKSNKFRLFFRGLFCVFSISMMLCKESFLLLTPALILSYITLVWLEDTSRSYIVLIKKIIPEIFILAVSFLFCIGYVLLKINTESMGYAGIKGVNYLSYLRCLYTIVFQGMIGVVSILLFVTSSILTYRYSKSNKNQLILHLLVLFISSFIILPQVFLYAKSGVFERYFLPSTLAWSLMMVFSFSNFKSLLSLHFEDKYHSKLFLFEILLICSLFFPSLVRLFGEASEFTREGKEVNAVLSFINYNSCPESTVLMIAEPISDAERTLSFRRYLGAVSGISKTYSHAVVRKTSDPFEEGLIRNFPSEFNSIIDKNSVDVFVGFPYCKNKMDSIVNSLGYDSKAMVHVNIGSYLVLLVNRNSQKPLEFNSNALPPTKSPNQAYNEIGFFPKRNINPGDSVTITVSPSKEIKDEMNAYIVLLDFSNPSCIAVHDHIFGKNTIIIKKSISSFISNPILIYRNWGKDADIPAASISYSVKSNNGITVYR